MDDRRPPASDGARGRGRHVGSVAVDTLLKRVASVAAAVFACAAIALPAVAVAETFVVQTGTALQPVVDAAPAGATVRLATGTHAGPITIARALNLIGDEGAVLQGPGTGSVVTVTGADVHIENLEIRGSGTVLHEMDAAVLLREDARGSIVRGNRLLDNLFGVYVLGAPESLVEGNLIEGRRDLRISEAGNGVSIWNSPGSKIVGNTIRYGRDGIFVKTSKQNTFQANRFADLRFAIHYMYTNDSKVIGNRSQGNHVGWAIMYSTHLEIRDNISDGDRDHGLLLNSTNYSTVTGNVVRGGGEKCAFVYNANSNRITENWFELCPIGIHFTAGSQNNVISGNAFIRNQTQIKYVSTRYVDWAHEGRGNYWSDNPAFDLDGDGISDRPYRPNDVIDDVLWRIPAAKVLINSPAVQAVRWAQARFPALHPGGVVDSRPLMRPVREVTLPPWKGPLRRGSAAGGSDASGGMGRNE